jgi:DNA-binding NarL/FixJ family response regulator
MSDNQPQTITTREHDVLKRLVKGETNQEIATALVITENTVKMHVRNILDKLHLQNRIQAAVYAVRENLVEEGQSQ